MLHVIYHKTFNETGLKQCIADDIWVELLDFKEWFNSPDMVDRSEEHKIKLAKLGIKEPEVAKIARIRICNPSVEESEECVKKRGRPKAKKE